MKIKTMELLHVYMTNGGIHFPEGGGVNVSLTKLDIIQLVRSEFGYTSKKARHLKKHFKRLINELLKDIE